MQFNSLRALMRRQPTPRGVSHSPQMSGAEFEIAFMESMIRHHWKAVIRGASCINRAYHAELIQLCGQIVETQTAEITAKTTALLGSDSSNGISERPLRADVGFA
jgi:uncharacterized protein (DUF305 family)